MASKELSRRLVIYHLPALLVWRKSVRKHKKTRLKEKRLFSVKIGEGCMLDGASGQSISGNVTSRPWSFQLNVITLSNSTLRSFVENTDYTSNIRFTMKDVIINASVENNSVLKVRIFGRKLETSVMLLPELPRGSTGFERATDITHSAYSQKNL